MTPGAHEARLRPRVLVAGIGNVFLGDDGFGVEVAQRLEREPVPPGTRVVDFGVRGLHLAFELLAEPELLVVVDATARGGAPGTLYLIDPAEEHHEATLPDAHAMHPGAVFAAVEHLGGKVPRSFIVGCEPESVDERMGLSPPVQEAVAPAIAMIRRLIESEVVP